MISSHKVLILFSIQFSVSTLVDGALFVINLNHATTFVVHQEKSLNVGVQFRDEER